MGPNPHLTVPDLDGSQIPWIEFVSLIHSDVMEDPTTFVDSGPFKSRYGRLGFHILIFAACCSLLAGGCVRRRMTIRSNPAGALAFVDDQEVGVTPVSTPFTYYATRKVQLFREGHETVTVKQPMPAPWYQIPPLDFFVENLWPFEVRDERVLEFDLPPQENVPNEKVLERAEMLRNNTRAGTITPLPASATTSP